MENRVGDGLNRSNISDSQPISTTDPNLLVFEKGETRIMDEGQNIDVIYPDFARGFDSLSYISFGEYEVDLVISSCGAFKHSVLEGP